MKKRRISKLAESKMLAILELENFIEFIQTVNPGLNLEESIILAGYTLHQVQELIKQDPQLLKGLKDMATHIRIGAFAAELKNQKATKRLVIMVAS